MGGFISRPDAMRDEKQRMIETLSHAGTFKLNNTASVVANNAVSNLSELSTIEDAVRENQKNATIIKLDYLYRDGVCFEEVYETCSSIVGHGTFGYVEKCTNRSTLVEAAVKHITKAVYTHYSMDITSINQEIKILKQCSGVKGILQLYDVFEDEKQVHLVMELAHGQELFRQIMTETKFSESHARSVVLQVSEALSYLHEHGIVHRDLKPENLLLVEKCSYTVKVCDFGLAKVFDSVNSNKFHQLWMTTACGTRLYAAPEVCRRESYNQSVDFWSLGVILYLMLCGDLPFSNSTLDNSNYELSFTDSVWEAVSQEAKDLVRMLLEPDSEKRGNGESVKSALWMQQTVQLPIQGVVARLRKRQESRVWNLESEVSDIFNSIASKVENMFVPRSKSFYDKIDKDENVSEIKTMHSFSPESDETVPLHDFVEEVIKHRFCTEADLQGALLKNGCMGVEEKSQKNGYLMMPSRRQTVSRFRQKTGSARTRGGETTRPSQHSRRAKSLSLPDSAHHARLTRGSSKRKLGKTELTLSEAKAVIKDALATQVRVSYKRRETVQL